MWTFKNLPDNYLAELGIELIGFTGKLGSGKDYMATILSNILPTARTLNVSLADMLKWRAMIEGGISWENVYLNKTADTRQLLQKLGTEEGRDKYGQDIWIQYAHAQMLTHHSRGVKRFFICDVRFENEIQYIRKMGGKVFKVVAPDRNEQRLELEFPNGVPDEVRNHPSEKALDNIPDSIYDAVIDNSKHVRPDQIIWQFAEAFGKGIKCVPANDGEGVIVKLI